MEPLKGVRAHFIAKNAPESNKDSTSVALEHNPNEDGLRLNENFPLIYEEIIARAELRPTRDTGSLRMGMGSRIHPEFAAAFDIDDDGELGKTEAKVLLETLRAFNVNSEHTTHYEYEFESGTLSIDIDANNNILSRQGDIGIRQGNAAARLSVNGDGSTAIGAQVSTKTGQAEVKLATAPNSSATVAYSLQHTSQHSSSTVTGRHSEDEHELSVRAGVNTKGVEVASTVRHRQGASHSQISGSLEVDVVQNDIHGTASARMATASEKGRQVTTFYSESSLKIQRRPTTTHTLKTNAASAHNRLGSYREVGLKYSAKGRTKAFGWTASLAAKLEKQEGKLDLQHFSELLMDDPTFQKAFEAGLPDGVSFSLDALGQIKFGDKGPLLQVGKVEFPLREVWGGLSIASGATSWNAGVEVGLTQVVNMRASVESAHRGREGDFDAKLFQANLQKGMVSLGFTLNLGGLNKKAKDALRDVMDMAPDAQLEIHEIRIGRVLGDESTLGFGDALKEIRQIHGTPKVYLETVQAKDIDAMTIDELITTARIAFYYELHGVDHPPEDSALSNRVRSLIENRADEVHDRDVKKWIQGANAELSLHNIEWTYELFQEHVSRLSHDSIEEPEFWSNLKGQGRRNLEMIASYAASRTWDAQALESAKNLHASLGMDGDPLSSTLRMQNALDQDPKWLQTSAGEDFIDTVVRPSLERANSRQEVDLAIQLFSTMEMKPGDIESIGKALGKFILNDAHLFKSDIEVNYSPIALLIPKKMYNALALFLHNEGVSWRDIDANLNTPQSALIAEYDTQRFTTDESQSMLIEAKERLAKLLENTPKSDADEFSKVDKEIFLTRLLYDPDFSKQAFYITDKNAGYRVKRFAQRLEVLFEGSHNPEGREKIEAIFKAHPILSNQAAYGYEDLFNYVQELRNKALKD